MTREPGFIPHRFLEDVYFSLAGIAMLLFGLQYRITFASLREPNLDFCAPTSELEREVLVGLSPEVDLE